MRRWELNRESLLRKARASKERALREKQKHNKDKPRMAVRQLVETDIGSDTVMINGVGRVRLPMMVGPDDVGKVVNFVLR